jgi:hypothetical protein
MVRRWTGDRAKTLIFAPLLILLALAAAAPVALGALASGHSGKLPPGTLRGNEHRLQEYPSVALASAEQRAAAERLLAEIRTTARGWRNLRAAAAAGFDTRTVRRRAGDDSVHYLHAEHHRYSHDRLYLDPRRPEALIYANMPGRRPLVLVGMMFSMPRGMHGRTPGGPITRWHTHTVCARGGRRGLTPRPDGSCPPGTSPRQGSEMLHVWLTNDLRSAYAIHAPARELGLAHLLPAAFCPLHNASARP